MGFLLTEKVPANTALSKLEQSIRELKPPASYYTLTGWPDGATFPAGDFKGQYVSATAGITSATYLAANLGSRSNNKAPAWELHGKQPAIKLDTRVPIETYSRAAWLIALGTQPVAQSGVHSTAWGFTTSGTAQEKAANKGEKNGLLAMGNLTAQIFGLFWYPDCNAPANNWSVGGVCMRMFNPSYVQDGGVWRMMLPARDAGNMGGDGSLKLAKMLAGCRESIEKLRKEKAEMKIEFDGAKNTAISIYNCAVTLQGTVQRAQGKEAWLLKKAKNYKRALKKVGVY
jgi:hypothetical protein